LGKQNKKVLLIDIDSQANASKVLIPDYSKLRRDDTICLTILDRKPLPIHSSCFTNVDIVPSHILLSDTDFQLTTAKDHREARLKTELEKIKDKYDYVLIDCPPALSWLTINAFAASDDVLVVIGPGYFELDSIGQINNTINEVIEFFNPNLNLMGYLFTMSEPTINSKTSLKLLRQAYTDLVLKTVIPRNTDLKDSQFNKTDIFSYRPLSKGAQAFSRLIEELFGYDQITK
jgi:chromosome partitioning protein